MNCKHKDECSSYGFKCHSCKHHKKDHYEKINTPFKFTPLDYEIPGPIAKWEYTLISSDSDE